MLASLLPDIVSITELCNTARAEGQRDVAQLNGLASALQQEVGL